MKVFNLAEAIMAKYPDAIPDVNFLVEYDPFKEESTVVYWHLPYPQLTEEEARTLGYEVDLNRVKENKRKELDALCKQTIINGFNYSINGVEYRFSNDIEAQNNFRDAREALREGMATEVEWTAHRVSDGERCRIMLNAQQLNEMKLVQFMHRNETVAKYNNILLKQVNPALKIEEVQAITW